MTWILIVAHHLEVHLAVPVLTFPVLLGREVDLHLTLTVSPSHIYRIPRHDQIYDATCNLLTNYVGQKRQIKMKMDHIDAGIIRIVSLSAESYFGT